MIAALLLVAAGSTGLKPGLPQQQHHYVDSITVNTVYQQKTLAEHLANPDVKLKQLIFWKFVPESYANLVSRPVGYLIFDDIKKVCIDRQGGWWTVRITDKISLVSVVVRTQHINELLSTIDIEVELRQKNATAATIWRGDSQ